MDSNARAVSPDRAIRVNDVGFAYSLGKKRRRSALENVSLDIPAGSIVSVVGPSGSGKSTLLSILAGLVKPSKGEIRQPFSRVGLVPQRPGLLAWRTVSENVSLPFELAGAAADGGAADRVHEILRLVGMLDHANSYPHELSGGMQSRVAIARALVNDPELLLLDEPFGALDEMTGQDLLVSLSDLIAQRRPTVFMITHSLAQATFLADRVAVFSSSPGRVAHWIGVEAAHPRDLSFLDTPAYQRAIAEVRHKLWEAKK